MSFLCAWNTARTHAAAAAASNLPPHPVKPYLAGPIDPRKGSPTFGQITSTPKVLWRNFNVYKALDVFGVPVGFDTDVNAPAIYEYMCKKRQRRPYHSAGSECTAIYSEDILI